MGRVGRVTTALVGRWGGAGPADASDDHLGGLEQLALGEVDHLVARVTQQPVAAELGEDVLLGGVLRHAVRFDDRLVPLPEEVDFTDSIRRVSCSHTR